jgi:Fe-S cluster assembly protein SufD
MIETLVEKKKRDNEWILEAREACDDSSSSNNTNNENETTIERMRSTAMKALSQSHTPTNRDESWRFFDVSDLTGAKLVKAEESNGDDDEAEEEEMKALAADAPEGAKVIAFVNGRFSEKWSSVGVGGDDGVSISRTIGGDVASAIGTYDEDEEVDGQGAIFARINKSCARSDNVVCVTVKTDDVENIVYIIHARKSSKDRKDGELMTGANARVFIDALAKSSVNVIEKYATVGGSGKKHASRYWANDVVEMRLAENARVFHSLSQDHGREAVHTRATYVRQNESSAYEINEVNVGARLHRHDLRVKQLGKKTDTKLNCFNLAGAKQTQDLHSSIILDFEEGTTDQRHRCIVSSSSGKGVFDGNVRVNKFAQRTDAKQITRNLLLVPKATVNTRPNLQIVADDVKCTHGCTVSDLEEEELFYIQSRGLTKEIARSLLVSGFGTEIISGMKGGEKFKEYVRETVKSALSKDAVELLVA